MVIRLRTGIAEYEKLVSYGSQNRTILDRLCAFLLAISPILQHYKGVYENAGFTVLLIAFPILTLRFFTKHGGRRFNSRNLIAILPLLLFELYTAVDHNVSLLRLLYIAFMMWIFFCVAAGCVNTVYFLKYATNIVSLAAILLVVQYISHYLFHRTLDLRPLKLLVSQDVIWVRSLSISRVGRLYRPAAFFLEPSHLFIYCFPIVAVLLLSPNMTKWRRNKALLLSGAMLLSTSGFGIIVTVGLLGVYLLLYRSDVRRKNVMNKLMSSKTILTAAALLAVLVLCYFTIPVFQRSVNRIILPTEGSSAIDGRIRLARNYIKTISGKAVLFGEKNVTGNLEFNLAGFFATYIKWGILGLLFTYWFYCRGLFILKSAYFWISLIIVVISFFTAHTHGTFYMLYYVIFLMEGYGQVKNQEYIREALIA